MAKSQKAKQEKVKTEETDAAGTVSAGEPLPETITPLLKELAVILAWSDPKGMGRSLMAGLLDQTDMDLAPLLEEGLDTEVLHINAKNGTYELNPKYQPVCRETLPPETREQWLKEKANRLGLWFEARRKESKDSEDFNNEFSHLTTWLQHLKPFACPETAVLIWLSAYPLFHEGKFVQCRETVQDALNLLADPAGSQILIKHKANMLTDMAYINGELGEAQTALNYLNEANTLMSTLGDDMNAEKADLLTSLGFTLDTLGKWEEAITEFKKAHEIRSAHLGPDHTETVSSLHNIGTVYFEVARFSEAINYFQQVLDIHVRTKGEGDATAAEALFNVTACQVHMKKFKDAYDFVVRYLKKMPVTSPKYNDVAGLVSYIDRESQKSGFRAPSTVSGGSGKSSKKKKKKK